MHSKLSYNDRPRVSLPVITTSVRFVPKMRLENLPPPSLPFPYDGNGGMWG